MEVDGRHKIGDRRCETGDRRSETETWDRRHETKDTCWFNIESDIEAPPFMIVDIPTLL